MPSAGLAKLPVHPLSKVTGRMSVAHPIRVAGPERVFCCGRAEFMGSELREHCGQLMCTERLEEPVGVVRVFVVQSVRGISTLGDLM